MSRTVSVRLPIRTAGLVRGAWGGALLLAAGPLTRRVGGSESRVARLAARCLGARHVAESILLLRSDGAARTRGVLAVDVIHSLSLWPLVFALHQQRRVVLAGAIAGSAMVLVDLSTVPAGTRLWPKPTSAKAQPMLPRSR